MSLLDLFSKLTGISAGELRAFLTRIATAVPDLAGTANRMLAGLDQPLTASSLALLAGVIKDEIGNVLQGRIDPRDHPSDLV